MLGGEWKIIFQAEIGKTAIDGGGHQLIKICDKFATE